MTRCPFIPLKWWSCFMPGAQTAFSDDPAPTDHVSKVQEITFNAARKHANPCAKVVVWVHLDGRAEFDRFGIGSGPTCITKIRGTPGYGFFPWSADTTGLRYLKADYHTYQSRI
jgi:hypothetical protein